MVSEGNKYVLLERVGVGGMAEVFRAKMVGPAGFQKIVALKRILDDFCNEQDFLHRFIDEAKLTARLQHPNICQVLDFGIIEGRYYITLEYVHGLDLALLLKRLEQQKMLLSPAHCLRIISGVLRGLSYAHRAVDEHGASLGIVHRDVSPQNVLLSVNGDIKLSDFGAAKANAAVRRARTKENIALGKLPYMAPEQRMGGVVDERTDLFTVGVLLAEMLQGPSAFRRNAGLNGTDKCKLAAIAAGRFTGDLARRIEMIICCAAEAHPHRRFSDALAMLSEIEYVALELRTLREAQSLGAIVEGLLDFEEPSSRHRQEPFDKTRKDRPQLERTEDLFVSDLQLNDNDSSLFSSDSQRLEIEDQISTAPSEIAVPGALTASVDKLQTKIIRGYSPTRTSANEHPTEVTRVETPRAHRRKEIVPDPLVPEADEFESQATQIYRGPVPSQRTHHQHQQPTKPSVSKQSDTPSISASPNPPVQSHDILVSVVSGPAQTTASRRRGVYLTTALLLVVVVGIIFGLVLYRSHSDDETSSSSSESLEERTSSARAGVIPRTSSSDTDKEQGSELTGSRE